MAKCIKCGKPICALLCKFYKRLGGWLCKKCSKEYMKKNGATETSTPGQKVA